MDCKPPDCRTNMAVLSPSSHACKTIMKAALVLVLASGAGAMPASTPTTMTEGSKATMPAITSSVVATESAACATQNSQCYGDNCDAQGAVPQCSNCCPSGQECTMTSDGITKTCQSLPTPVQGSAVLPFNLGFYGPYGLWRIVLPLDINGHEVPVMVDTGSSTLATCKPLTKTLYGTTFPYLRPTTESLSWPGPPGALDPRSTVVMGARVLYSKGGHGWVGIAHHASLKAGSAPAFEYNHTASMVQSSGQSTNACVNATSATADGESFGISNINGIMGFGFLNTNWNWAPIGLFINPILLNPMTETADFWGGYGLGFSVAPPAPFMAMLASLHTEQWAINLPQFHLGRSSGNFLLGLAASEALAGATDAVTGTLQTSFTAAWDSTKHDPPYFDTPAGGSGTPECASLPSHHLC